jgi:hypothetical protein
MIELAILLTAMLAIGGALLELALRSCQPKE